MAIRSSNFINEGDFIYSEEGNVFYIQTKITNPKGEVEAFVGLPVLRMREYSDQEAGIIPVRVSEIQDKDRSHDLGEFLGINLNHGLYKIQPNERYSQEHLGTARSDVQQAVHRLFRSMNLNDLKLGGLPDSKASVGVMDWSRVADWRVVGELNLEEEAPKSGARPKKTRAQKAKALVNVPDLYLEDAVEQGFLSRRTYDILQHDRENIVTLRDAWLLAQRTGEKPLSKLIQARDFDTSFPANQFQLTSIEERIRAEDSVQSDDIVAYALESDLDLEQSVARKLISQKTADILRQRNTERSYDERAITHLEEAFRLVAVDPDYLSEYNKIDGRPDQTLTKPQQRQVISELKSAYSKLSISIETASVTNDLNEAMRGFSEKMIDLLGETFVLKRHDARVPTSTKIESDRNNQIAKMKSNRPPQLSS